MMSIEKWGVLSSNNTQNWETGLRIFFHAHKIQFLVQSEPRNLKTLAAHTKCNLRISYFNRHHLWPTPIESDCKYFTGKTIYSPDDYPRILLCVSLLISIFFRLLLVLPIVPFHILRWI